MIKKQDLEMIREVIRRESSKKPFPDCSIDQELGYSNGLLFAVGAIDALIAQDRDVNASDNHEIRSRPEQLAEPGFAGGDMKFTVVSVEKYGKRVKQHPIMDELRRTQCLCLNCSEMNCCPIAAQLFELCNVQNIALAVTRCPEFNQNPRTS